VTSRGPRHAHLEGFDLHANRTVRADDRAGLERLCQYLLRPPLAQGRLERLADGRVLYTLTHPWSDGTRQLLLHPLELLEKLAVLVPRPRINLLLYHGGSFQTTTLNCPPLRAEIPAIAEISASSIWFSLQNPCFSSGTSVAKHMASAVQRIGKTRC
jgi:hypothetical protein